MHLSLPMPAVAVACHPRAAENRASAALQRGPLVYCLEAHDNPGVSVLDALLDPEGEVVAEHRPDLLGGITLLRAGGAVPLQPEGPLYFAWRRGRPGLRRATLSATPYYAWNNRGPCAMTVWMQTM